MLKDWLKITNDPVEIKDIAKQLVKYITINIGGTCKTFYTPLMLSKMEEEIFRRLPDTPKSEREDLLYRFIYDYWVYGCTVAEEFYLHLKEKNDAEKRKYMVGQIRSTYVHHLNWNAGADRVEQLEDKYRLYQRLKPYYKREIIEISELSDLEIFSDFAKKHKDFVVKPANFSLGVGVHKVSMDDYDNDYRVAFESILSEGRAIHDRHPSKATRMVIEELIRQDEALNRLHPYSINPIRATAVMNKYGKIVLYRPRIKIGANKSFVGSGAQNSFLLEIDPDTGMICTDGYQESGDVASIHPDTHIVFKGYQIPHWQECVDFVKELMEKLPGYGYIGWDIALSNDGWCVVEGNYSGEFGSQMIRGKGLRPEFEELIGWRYDKDFWWEENERFMHN